MDGRAGLLSEAHYFGHRMKKADLKEADRAREENDEDAAELALLIARCLENHREEMLSWAEAASRVELSAPYRTGWQQTFLRWRASPGRSEGQSDSDGQGADSPPALSWLIAMWHRARESADE